MRRIVAVLWIFGLSLSMGVFVGAVAQLLYDNAHLKAPFGSFPRAAGKYRLSAGPAPLEDFVPAAREDAPPGVFAGSYESESESVAPVLHLVRNMGSTADAAAERDRLADDMRSKALEFLREGDAAIGRSPSGMGTVVWSSGAWVCQATSGDPVAARDLALALSYGPALGASGDLGGTTLVHWLETTRFVPAAAFIVGFALALGASLAGLRALMRWAERP
jgi:hypothetical protein